MDDKGLINDAHFTALKVLVEGLLFQLLADREYTSDNAAELGMEFLEAWRAPKKIGGLDQKQVAMFINAGAELLTSMFDTVEGRLRAREDASNTYDENMATILLGLGHMPD